MEHSSFLIEFRTKARNVLIVAKSCFAGEVDRIDPIALTVTSKNNPRTLMGSGIIFKSARHIRSWVWESLRGTPYPLTNLVPRTWRRLSAVSDWT